MRYMTGIKPTGKLHLGHFISVIKPMLDLKAQGHNIKVFVADLHALNTLPMLEAYEFKEDMMTALNEAFHYTDVYESDDFEGEIEMYYTKLMQIVNLGVLKRCHGYKACEDKDNINMGLLTYPVLMTADIMAIEPDVVVIGPDQVQHMEFARDLIKKYNKAFNESVKIPEYQVKDVKVLGTDGEKMSKSKDNCLYLDATDEDIRHYVYKLPTDTFVTEEGCRNLLDLAKEIMTPTVYNMYKISCKHSTSFKELKDILVEALIEYYNDYVRVE